MKNRAGACTCISQKADKNVNMRHDAGRCDVNKPNDTRKITCMSNIVQHIFCIDSLSISMLK